jgi:hypothetical protein
MHTMTVREFLTNVAILSTIVGCAALIRGRAVTPNSHKIHHSRELSETNSNYGNVLTIYDRIFGTFTPSDRAPSVADGLDEVDPEGSGSFGALLSMPFEREGFLTQKSGLDPAHTDTIPV